MEEEQFQLEEFDEDGSEMRLCPNLHLEGSIIKTPKEKSSTGHQQRGV